MAKKEQNLISKKDIIADVLERYPQSAEVFMEYGFHCLGCMGATSESIEDGCTVHGIDADKMVADINKTIGKKH